MHSFIEIWEHRGEHTNRNKTLDVSNYEIVTIKIEMLYYPPHFLHSSKSQNQAQNPNVKKKKIQKSNHYYNKPPHKINNWIKTV